LDGSLERDGCTSTRNVTFRVWGERGARRSAMVTCEGSGTTRRRGMEWHGMPRCRQRAEWLNASKGRPALRCIAWHGQSAAVSRLTPLPASFVAHQPALPFFSLGGQPPVGEKGEKGEKRAEAQEARRRHYWGDGGADYIHYMHYSIYYYILWYPVPESP
jgi:hypothetical protein